MAVFEQEHARIVIRVVYDGPGRAGKTTNAEQLARIFANKPGNELHVTPAATGRTIFFDWFSFDAGMLDGHQLQVQVVTVPGHKSLEPRRAHILHTADAVVLVCDSAPSGQDSAREMLDSLREHLGKRVTHVPLIVQANKQDLANALAPQELGAALRLGPEVTVVGAQASAGVGVRDTVVAAIRAAIRQMKRATATGGMSAIAGRAGTMEELRAALQSIEAVSARGPARTPHEEARAALLPATVERGSRVVYIRSNNKATQIASARGPGLREPVSHDPPLGHERTSRPSMPVSAMFAEPLPASVPTLSANDLPESLPAEAAPVVLEAPSPPPAGETIPASQDMFERPSAITSPRPVGPPPLETLAELPPRPPVIAGPAHAPLLEPELAPPERDPARPAAPHVRPPSRPGPELPPGHVWPVPGGRAVLERIALEQPEPRESLEGHVFENMSFCAAGFRLRTRPEWRFPERDAGRAALLDHARRTARLGPLLAAGTTLALAADPEDTAALWHIVPDLPSLGAELLAAPEHERPRHFARLAAAYAAALRLVAREGVAVELDPQAFGEQDGRYVYLDDRVHDRTQAPDLATALIAPCVDRDGVNATTVEPDPASAYLDALEQALAVTLTRDDIAALGLDARLEAMATSPTRDPHAAQAARRVRASLSRCS